MWRAFAVGERPSRVAIMGRQHGNTCATPSLSVPCYLCRRPMVGSGLNFRSILFAICSIWSSAGCPKANDEHRRLREG